VLAPLGVFRLGPEPCNSNSNTFAEYIVCLQGLHPYSANIMYSRAVWCCQHDGYFRDQRVCFIKQGAQECCSHGVLQNVPRPEG